MFLGVDTGGTFTDFVLVDSHGLRIHKVLSTPHAPEQAILQGIRELGLEEALGEERLNIVHGSTVATNAALEGKGARTAYIGNRGLSDIIVIGRQTRQQLYHLHPEANPEPVPRELRFETGGRLNHLGQVLEPLTAEDIAQLRQELAKANPEAVAINLLYSYVDDSLEQRLEAALQEDGYFVSRSSFVLPEYKEYERGIATWLNAWLGPIVAGYLTRLQQHLPTTPIAVMQSAGGTIAASLAARRAVNLLLSGPAGGLAAALYMGRKSGEERLITFDMGGTSTDVALLDGRIQLTSEGHIGPYPVAVPMVDMHTIGAGGGSIAYIDEGGLLQVGPASAGANPGPACYGLGGKLPTVTDANVVLGRLPASTLLGGHLTLNPDAARAALAPLAERLTLSIETTAEGIVALANEHMARALRKISVQRGHDPAEFVLFCFGGAGGLHLCDLAESLGMHRAMVPPHGGVYSALGMLVAPRERQLSRTVQRRLEDNTTLEQDIEILFADMLSRGTEEMEAEGIPATQVEAATSAELRYEGQSFTLNVPWKNSRQAAEAFTQLHEQRYGHRLESAIELVTLRLALGGPKPELELPVTTTIKAETGISSRLYGSPDPVPVLARGSLSQDDTIIGPAIISEPVATTMVAAGWQAYRDALGNLHLTRSQNDFHKA